MTRAEAARIVCQRLSRDVDGIAPAGIGRWKKAWAMTAAADGDFVLALAGWEQTGAESDRLRVRAAYDQVLAAWHDAAREYLREFAP